MVKINKRERELLGIFIIILSLFLIRKFIIMPIRDDINKVTGREDESREKIAVAKSYKGDIEKLMDSSQDSINKLLMDLRKDLVDIDTIKILDIEDYENYTVELVAIELEYDDFNKLIETMGNLSLKYRNLGIEDFKIVDKSKVSTTIRAYNLKEGLGG